MKVVSFNRRKKTIDPHLIEALEKLLQAAKDGDIEALAAVVEHESEGATMITVGLYEPYRMSGLLAELSESVRTMEDDD